MNLRKPIERHTDPKWQLVDRICSACSQTACRILFTSPNSYIDAWSSRKSLSPWNLPGKEFLFEVARMYPCLCGICKEGPRDHRAPQGTPFSATRIALAFCKLNSIS